MKSLCAQIRVAREQFVVEAEVRLDGVIGLIGPSGSGKSTILRAVAGLEDGTRGFEDVGYLGQIDGLFPHMSAAGNVAYPLRANGCRKTESQDAAALFLDALELGEVANSRPGALSGGQRRRVALARSLAPRRALYVLDEPFSGLDEAAADVAAQFIAACLLEHDAPALIAGHDFDRLDRICGRIERVERGRLVATSALSDAVAPPRVQAPAAGLQNTGDRPVDSPGDSR